MSRGVPPSRSRSATAWCGSATRTASTSPRAARPSSTSSHYYLSRRRRHRQRAARAAVHAAPLPRRASTGEKVHQKRLPAGAPPWVETVRVHFPRYEPHRRRALRHRAGRASSGRCRCRPSSSTPGTAAAPTPRSPTSGASTSTRCRSATSTRVRRVAHVAHEVLDELGAVGWPKTSGGYGLHVYVRIEPRAGASRTYAGRRWPSPARSSAAPDDVTTTWWRKDRDPRRLFVDYNQNARDHTIAARVLGARQPRGTVSTPITLGRGRRRRAAGLHHRHDARALRRARRPARRHRRRGLRPRRRCWSGPTATSATAPQTPEPEPEG